MGLLAVPCTAGKLDAGLTSRPSLTYLEEELPRSRYVRNLADDPIQVILVATLLLSWVVEPLMTWGMVAALEAAILAGATLNR